jgi:hypothetical protein
MTNESDRQSARGGYKWLRFSPLLTIPTLLFIINNGPGYSLVCKSDYFTCNYTLAGFISILTGVLCSALWHLILIQYANKKDNEYLMCNTFNFRLRPSRPNRVEGDRTSNSGKHILYEPKPCGSSGVENATGHGREFGLLRSALSNESQPFQQTS